MEALIEFSGCCLSDGEYCLSACCGWVGVESGWVGDGWGVCTLLGSRVSAVGGVRVWALVGCFLLGVGDGWLGSGWLRIV